MPMNWCIRRDSHLQTLRSNQDDTCGIEGAGCIVANPKLKRTNPDDRPVTAPETLAAVRPWLCGGPLTRKQKRPEYKQQDCKVDASNQREHADFTTAGQIHILEFGE
jgi:hypothetical protein